VGNPTLQGVTTLQDGDRSPDFTGGKPALQGVTALPLADELPSLQTGSMVGEGAFTINDVIGRFRNGFAYSAMNNAGRVAILYEFFPHHLVVREGYEEVKPKQGEETDFAKAVAAYETSVEALREADYESLPRVSSTLWANGTFYVATEERSLQGYDRLMDAGGATGGKRPRVIANAVSQALEALIKMHGLGFEHGAITPDMIHISSEGDVRITGPILLTSLAAPTVQDGAGAEVPNPFIAPELLENPYGVTVQSDLYALAASFYNAITRRPPPDAKSRAEAAALKVADHYSPLRKVAVLYRPAFRRALDAAMAYDPAERPNTAENWLAHIRQDAMDEATTSINDSFLANLVATPEAGQIQEAETLTEMSPEPEAEVPSPKAEPEPKMAAPAKVAPQPVAPQPATSRVRESAARQAPAPVAPKSNKGVILGAGGLVAALALAGVMFMGGGEEPAPAGTEPVVEATAEPAAEVAATATAETAPAGTAIAASDPEPTASEAVSSETAATEPATAQTSEAPVETAATETSAEPGIDVTAELTETEAVVATEPVATETAQPVVEAQAEPATIAAPAGEVLQTQISFAAWDVEMPFMEDKRIVGTQPAAVVTRVLPGTELAEAGSWIAPGVFIFSVNGTPVQQGGGTANAVLNALKVDPDGKARVAVEHSKGASAAREVGLMTVKAHRLVSLSNGISVQITAGDDGWQTVVTAIANPSVSGLQVGDVLFRDKTSGTALNGENSLETILAGLVDSGVSVTEFSIIRASKVETAGMQLATTAGQ
jgi:serine/threonine protein kinase